MEVYVLQEKQVGMDWVARGEEGGLLFRRRIASPFPLFIKEWDEVEAERRGIKVRDPTPRCQHQIPGITRERLTRKAYHNPHSANHS